jgi:hypothetical protein
MRGAHAERSAIGLGPRDRHRRLSLCSLLDSKQSREPLVEYLASLASDSQHYFRRAFIRMIGLWLRI